LEDKEGNLWIGTSDRGAIKRHSRPVDEEFRFETISKTQGMISDYVTSMYSDRAGDLWFGTDKGVSKYDGESFQHIYLGAYLTFGYIEDIFEDSRGAMWFVTTNDGGSE